MEPTFKHHFRRFHPFELFMQELIFSKTASAPSMTRSPRFTRFSIALAVTLSALGTASQPAHAALIGYNVNLGTFGLAGQDRDTNGVNDTYRLDYFFNNGGTSGNSTATLGNFSFGGGVGTAATPPTFSDRDAPLDGDGFPILTPASSGTLTTPGNQLSFNVAFDYTIDSPAPDQFSFAIYNNANSQYIGTTSGDGISLFTIDFTAGNPNVNTYGSQATPGNPDYGLSAPTVTATPEPETWAMMALGICSVGLLGWKRRKSEATI
jgi:hypothetical protein